MGFRKGGLEELQGLACAEPKENPSLFPLGCTSGPEDLSFEDIWIFLNCSEVASTQVPP